MNLARLATKPAAASRTMMVTGGGFTLSALAGSAGHRLEFYGLSGKRVKEMEANQGALDLRKDIGIPEDVYILRATPIMRGDAAR